MIDEWKDDVGGLAVNETFIMNKAVQVTKVDGVYVFRAIGFVSSNERDKMRNTQPEIQVTDYVAHKSTARIRLDGGEGAEGAIVFKECSGQCDGRIIQDSMSAGKFGVVLDNEEEAYAAIFISRSDGYMIDTN